MEVNDYLPFGALPSLVTRIHLRSAISRACHHLVDCGTKANQVIAIDMPGHLIIPKSTWCCLTRNSSVVNSNPTLLLLVTFLKHGSLDPFALPCCRFHHIFLVCLHVGKRQLLLYHNLLFEIGRVLIPCMWALSYPICHLILRGYIISGSGLFLSYNLL